MKTKNFTYREMTLSSAQVEVPRETYQRSFNAQRARKIADEFDERIANEPRSATGMDATLCSMASTPSPPGSS